MGNRIVTIVNKDTKEKLDITWMEALQYYEGHACFEELKKKYSEKTGEARRKN